MSDRVLIDVQDHIATVTLNRPDKYNAFDPEMFDAVSDAGRTLSARKDVHVIVLTGAGGNFSAGLDISGMGQGGDPVAEFGKVAYELIDDTPANRFQHPAYVWYAAPQPVIAAIDGVCLGAGTQLIAGADIRLSSPAARFAVLEVKWGLVPDMAFSAVFRHTMRLDHLKQLAYTGRIIESDDALRYGLISEIHADPLAAAMNIAGEIVARSPDAVRATKHLINAGWNQSPEESLALEARTQHAMMGKPNQIEAMMSNVQKRAPDYAPPIYTPSDSEAK